MDTEMDTDFDSQHAIKEPNGIKIVIDTRHEYEPITGNVLNSGDPTIDREAEDAVRKAYYGGNRWAWCTIEVEASFGGYATSEYLTCCSYKDVNEFLQCQYFTDLKSKAIDDLKKKILAGLALSQKAAKDLGLI